MNTELIQAEIDAHEENAERAYAEYDAAALASRKLWQRYYNGATYRADWPDEETKAEHARLSARAEELRRAYMMMPYREYHVQIAGGGKVHRVFAPSRHWLHQPYCGSSRWNSQRARIVNAPVTCEKCGVHHDHQEG